MADRSHKTRQKLTFRLAQPKPRNPLAVPASRRVAGPHRKARGALRAAERLSLKREAGTKDPDD
jgi:hypothetical protein